MCIRDRGAEQALEQAAEEDPEAVDQAFAKDLEEVQDPEEGVGQVDFEA